MPPETGGLHIFSHSSNHPSAEAAKRFPGQLHAHNSGRPGVRDGKQDGIPVIARGKVMANCHVYCACCPCDKERSYWLTLRSRVLLAKPTAPHRVIKFPALFGIQRSVAVITTACHLFLSRGINTVHALPTQPFKIHFNIILPPTNPNSFKWSLSLRFPHFHPVRISPLPIRATCPTELILLDLISRIINKA